MRFVFAAAAAMIVAAPAMAQDRPENRVAAQLNDPLVQAGLAGAVNALVGIVLDTRVGPVARHIDRDARAGDTLRDLKRRDDPQFEARLHEDVRRSVARTGAMAGDVAVVMGEARTTAARLHAALAPLVAAVDRANDN